MITNIPFPQLTIRPCHSHSRKKTCRWKGFPTMVFLWPCELCKWDGRYFNFLLTYTVHNSFLPNLFQPLSPANLNNSSTTPQSFSKICSSLKSTHCNLWYPTLLKFSSESPWTSPFTQTLPQQPHPSFLWRPCNLTFLQMISYTNHSTCQSRSSYKFAHFTCEA